MKYYQDITLLPDAESNLGFLWQKVYQQLHLALVENKTADNHSSIGISIPEYSENQKEKIFPLGSKLRLFAQNEEQLERLDMGAWLRRLTDYMHCTSIKEVPSSIDKFVCFKRKQCDTNAERLARRRAKRKGESLEQALEHFAGFKDQNTKLPFVNVKSLSGDQEFRLFIEKEVVEQSRIAEFSCYGLSSRDTNKQASVPWF